MGHYCSSGEQSVSHRGSIRALVLIIYAANEQCEEGFEDEDDAEGWQGNRRRRLWKSTCIKAALNVESPFPHLFNLSYISIAQLARSRAGIICGARANPSNIQRPQVSMSDMGRSSMGSNKYTMRRETNSGNNQVGGRLLGGWAGGTQRFAYSSGRSRPKRRRRVGEGSNCGVGDTWRRQCRRWVRYLFPSS